tara:strand:- start:906 stop:2006 length:1101 start_codon:yes stop_codon:yes gene_type:complete
MASKVGVELRTDFTGDDKRFKPVVARNIKDAKRTGKAWEDAGKKGSKGIGKMKNALVAVAKKATVVAAGIAAIGKEATVTRDKLLLSKKADMGFENFQALAFVLEQFKIEADETAEIVFELSRAVGEAAQGDTGKQDAFANLRISWEKFEKLKPLERVLALSKALQELPGGRDKGLAALGPILGDTLSTTVLTALGDLGPQELSRQMGQVLVRTQASGEKAKRDADFTRLMAHNKGLGILGKGLSLFRGDFSGLTRADFSQGAALSAFDPSIRPKDPAAEKAAADLEKKRLKLEEEKAKEKEERIQALRTFGGGAKDPLALLGMQGTVTKQNPMQKELVKQTSALDMIKQLNKQTQRGIEQIAAMV